jgi:large subunit ribosomal protein L9
MDVVLLQDVEKVGLKGDVVSVARGYARNYLLPRRLAEPATPGRLSELRRHEELRARHEAQSVEQARDVATTLEQTELRFEVKAGPTGSLFGSVTATDVVEELWRARRIRVDRRKIALPESIKRIGRYEVPVELYTDVSVDVRVLVVPEGGELPAEEQVPAAEETAEEQPAAEHPGAEEPQGAEAQSAAEQSAAEEPAETPPSAEESAPAAQPE